MDCSGSREPGVALDCNIGVAEGRLEVFEGHCPRGVDGCRIKPASCLSWFSDLLAQCN